MDRNLAYQLHFPKAEHLPEQHWLFLEQFLLAPLQLPMHLLFRHSLEQQAKFLLQIEFSFLHFLQVRCRQRRSPQQSFPLSHEAPVTEQLRSSVEHTPLMQGKLLQHSLSTLQVLPIATQSPPTQLWHSGEGGESARSGLDRSEQPLDSNISFTKVLLSRTFPQLHRLLLKDLAP